MIAKPFKEFENIFHPISLISIPLLHQLNPIAGERLLMSIEKKKLLREYLHITNE